MPRWAALAAAIRPAAPPPMMIVSQLLDATDKSKTMDTVVIRELKAALHKKRRLPVDDRQASMILDEFAFQVGFDLVRPIAAESKRI